ncbi:tRNA 2-thiouridine(34) synthase MnmA [Sinanaerobacter sp. ZZT-01]|uniref:tRNA 2-thiouridine(34) synthase MnmA n=1 Tax=Sinanaerobacter sp. ZZT-01 TaxID=3111540 RepID=UPI002D792114|nr:tRNA 2-thiouridine(34) synthase MnmA [Sinanaerobacter sp. ZZT-01]WRR93093.1 tRNA 2-thiouridine(34) synthase MnmA [Sinanaerobacter sp. ZZT-01]
MTKTMEKNNKVVLGLSGGVDSTAAALLLKEKGYEVIGLFFDVLGNQKKEKERAEQAARELEIAFVYRNIKEAFSENVISYFCKSYQKGETPNPCILCNPTIKFKLMQEEADRLGAFYLATGHYAKIEFEQKTGCHFIKRAENEKKDQSYMLYRLPQSIIRRLLFPLGSIESKELTRNFVREHRIHNADLKDSQEICFIKEGSYIDYLNHNGYTGKPGNFVDKEGTILGKHSGIINYTIGQRKGLGITFGKPMFVIGMDEAENQVVLGENEDLFQKTIYAKNCRFSIQEEEAEMPEEYNGISVLAKIRYASKPSKAIIYKAENGMVRAEFEEMQRAATPGQSIVFYMESRLIGGGFISQKQ